jgi:alpha-L-rhamnosidase
MAVSVGHLTVEHTPHPVGIDVTPRFGWWVDADHAGVEQVAYRLTVFVGEHELWTSGEVVSPECVDVPYAGPALAPLREYAWRVAVTTTAGVAEAASAFTTGLVDGDWHGARWIGFPHPSGAAPLLRTEFAVRSGLRRALLVVAAGGYARVRLNGSAVEPFLLSPGFTDYDVSAQYTVSDVTDLLSPGGAALSAELGRGFYGMAAANTWNWETAPWHAEPCTRMLLRLEYADGSADTVTTGPGWHAVDGPTRYDDLYGGEDFDARLDVPAASIFGFDDADWSSAVVVDGPKGRPVHQRQQPIGVVEEFEPERIVRLGPGRWVVSFPCVIAGWVAVEAEGEPGSTIELRYGETLRADGTPNSDDEKGYFAGRFQTDRVTLGDGPLSWEPRFGYKGFQHVEVRAASLPRLRARLVHSLVARTGEFACSSELLTTLHELTVRTVLNNLHGLPTDTPMYEKNGWTGDGMLGAELMLLNLDAHELLAKWSADIAASRHGDGAPEVIAPHGGWTMDWSPAPTWHAALLLVPWELYRQRGDLRVLRDVWPDAVGYLRFELARRRDGLAETTLGDWVGPETDAGGGNPPEDLRVAATAYLAAMLDTAAAIADALGEDAGEWREAAAEVRAAFVAAFLDRDTGEVRGTGDEGYRQAHAVLALAFALLPEPDRRRVADRLARDVRERGHHLNTGALATKHLLPVLTAHGHAATALAVAEQRTFPSWGFWVEQGATTLWEHWKAESRSRGHYFLGTVDDWLFADVAGLRPTAPGWRAVRIEPRVFDGERGETLTWARAAVATPRGRLSVSWRREAATLVVEGEVPVGTDAVVVLPDGSAHEVGAGRYRLRCADPGAAHQAV